MVRVDASGSYIDSTSYFNQMFNGGIYQFQGAKLPDSIHARIKHITGTIPARLWIENTIIGSPDAYDQCGYYIEVDGKQWEIDPDTHPEYLDPFLSGIDSALMIVGRANPQPSNQ